MTLVTSSAITPADVGYLERGAMCAGAIYWAGIGRLVFALSAAGLAAMVTEEDGVPPLRLPAREVFARGGRPIVVDGPVPLPSATAVHEGFWS